jgi:hypothetical protein
MSGVLGASIAPCSVEEARRVYETFLIKLGIEERGTGALENLRALDVQEIVETTAAFTEDGRVFRTVRDKDWFGDSTELVGWNKLPELIGKCEWVDEIVLGTTSLEVGHRPISLPKKSSYGFSVGCHIYTETLRRHATGFHHRHRSSAWRGERENSQPGLWYNTRNGSDSFPNTSIAVAWRCDLRW